LSHEGYLHPSDPNIISADDRRKLVDWCYAVVDHCQLSRETVASAMDMVDRFLSMPSNSVDAARVSDEALRDESKFQLLTVAALYSSIKVHERVAVSSDLFAEICRQAYTAQEIEDTERILLSGLSWRCHAPTAHQIGLSILSLLLPYVDIPEVTWGFLIDEMKYLTELAVRDYYFSTQRRSTIALAAIFNVIRDMSTKERQEILGAFLCVIMDCFEFDHSKHIAAARTRLQYLATATPAITLQEDDVDERSLDESVITMKVSNSSSSLERSSLCDIYEQKQDFCSCRATKDADDNTLTLLAAASEHNSANDDTDTACEQSQPVCTCMYDNDRESSKT
jgi:hypothetical protein